MIASRRSTDSGRGRHGKERCARGKRELRAARVADEVKFGQRTQRRTQRHEQVGQTREVDAIVAQIEQLGGR